MNDPSFFCWKIWFGYWLHFWKQANILWFSLCWFIYWLQKLTNKSHFRVQLVEQTASYMKYWFGVWVANLDLLKFGYHVVIKSFSWKPVPKSNIRTPGITSAHSVNDHCNLARRCLPWKSTCLSGLLSTRSAILPRHIPDHL